jgi:hypothetical protein
MAITTHSVRLYAAARPLNLTSPEHPQPVIEQNSLFAGRRHRTVAIQRDAHRKFRKRTLMSRRQE